MTMQADRAVEDYLRRLRSELRDVPKARRRELVAEISEHIAQARTALAPGDEAGLLNVPDRGGDPADIAAAARERQAPAPRMGALEVSALVLMLPGSLFPPVIGWLAGAVMLWISSAWTTFDKVVGMLVVPFGLMPAFLVLTLGGYSETCSSDGRGPEICTGGPEASSRSSGSLSWSSSPPPPS